jgi:hypothetical protein
MNNQQMNKIRFTQTIKLSVTVEAEIPSDWNADTFAEEWITNVTVSEPSDPAENGKGFIINQLSLDDTDLDDVEVWVI